MTTVLQWPLEEGESIVWQGRPAPRCYVFRHWLQALFGTLIFLASSFWLMVGYHLVVQDNLSRWLLAIPGVLILVSFLIGPGQIMWARIRWENIFYALTEQHLLVIQHRDRQRVQRYLLKNLICCKKRKYGKNQVSYRLSFNDQRVVIVECLEHSDLFSGHLPDIDDPVTGESV